MWEAASFPDFNLNPNSSCKAYAKSSNGEVYKGSWKPREGELSSAKGARESIWCVHVCVLLYKNKIRNDLYVSGKNNDLIKSG